MYPLYTYTGVRDGEIRTPDGVDGDIVFQSFKLASDPMAVNDTSVDVGIVKSTLRCETAEAKILDSLQSQLVTARTPNVQLKSETCSLGSDVQKDPWWIPAGRLARDWQLDYQLQRIECPRGVSSDGTSLVLDTNLTKDIRYAMIVSNISVNSSSPLDPDVPAGFDDTYPIASVKQITAIFCHLEYNTGEATLLRDFTQNT
ncbi:hypothetical protein AC578_187 [Pseudocercospora eumusae]|uniref:Uncharacterized protein n=1 Tax=Pseudocercospora eumusae TaxID=321146 RepID=A0A139HIP8_9PEZI|nr:hypothetical protein AC578_187 [Pseudocercospora eumusae]